MNFRKLDVYQAAVQFLPTVSRITHAIPSTHAALAEQFRMASLSVPLNIAEGSGKTGAADQRRYFAIARGSAMECAAIIDACRALDLVEPAVAEEADTELLAIIRMLSRMCLR